MKIQFLMHIANRRYVCEAELQADQVVALPLPLGPKDLLLTGQVWQTNLGLRVVLVESLQPERRVTWTGPLPCSKVLWQGLKTENNSLRRTAVCQIREARPQHGVITRSRRHR